MYWLSACPMVAVALQRATPGRCSCTSFAGAVCSRHICLACGAFNGSDEEVLRKKKDKKHKRSKKKRRDRSIAASDDEAPRKKHRR
jgi:hypothetical protein